MLDLVGLDVPAGIEGRSQRAVLLDGAPAVRERIIGRVTQLRSDDDPMGRPAEGDWLRAGRWFFQWRPDAGAEGLFDLVADPAGDANRLAAHPELAERFAARTRDWRRRQAGR